MDNIKNEYKLHLTILCNTNIMILIKKIAKKSFRKQLDYLRDLILKKISSIIICQEILQNQIIITEFSRK
jgi:hypothetical protein